MRKEKGSDISEESVLALQERIKELDCLYKIYKSLHKATNSDEAVRLVLDQLAGGFRYPDLVTVRIVIDGRQCSSKDTWHESRTIFSDLIVDGRTVGEIGVSLSDQVKFPGEPFLDEERNLLCAVAVGLSNSLEKISTSQIFRENLERFSFAVEASGEGIWDWNIETGEAFFSKRWKDMLGLSDDQVSDRVEE
ncbi:hypothetical protein [Mesotoga sp.]